MGSEAKSYRKWEEIKEGDFLFFYATAPVKGVIGYGKITTKFIQKVPLWSKEVEENTVIWPFRFEFDIEYCLPPNAWQQKPYTNRSIQHLAIGGFRRIQESVANDIIAYFKTIQEQSNSTSVAGEKSIPLDKLRNMLQDIGKMQGFIAERSYTEQNFVLDMVWRRVERSVPTYVFEVCVEGNFHLSLAKLKHAYDLWNSHIFLITSAEKIAEIELLLSGTFHEISDKIKILKIEDIQRLYSLKKQYKDFEKKLGIL